MAKPRTIPDDLTPPNTSTPTAGYERHFLGRFGEAVVCYLGRAQSLGTIDGQETFLVVDSIELGDNPFDEEIGVDFHLSPSPPPADHIPHWGPLAPGRHVERTLEYGMISSSSETRYAFVFTSAMSIGENEAEFLDFLRDEAHMTPAVRDGSARRDSGAPPHPQGPATPPGLGNGTQPSAAEEPTSRRSAS